MANFPDDAEITQTLELARHGRCHEQVFEQAGSWLASLNTKGKPIVSSPADCMECLHESGLDAIFIGDYLIHDTKKLTATKGRL